MATNREQRIEEIKELYEVAIWGEELRIGALPGRM